MKKTLLATTLSVFAISVMATELNTDDQKISYTIGAQIGASLSDIADGPVKLDKNAIFDAISDILAQKEPQLSMKDMSNAMQLFAEKSEKFTKEKIATQAKANAEEGKKYLDANKAKDGVKVTSSGLQYRVITEGKGKKPNVENIVKVHYKGTLPDGTVFDSSIERGKPAEFPLKGVIKGWTEGLQLMPVGSKYEFVIPAELAYGKKAPASIGPDRVLIFEVELLDIIKDKPLTNSKVEEKKDKAAKSE